MSFPKKLIRVRTLCLSGRMDWRTVSSLLLIAGMFLLYAVAVSRLDQGRYYPFYVDEEGGIPAAVTREIDRTAPGVVDKGILQYFKQTAREQPAEIAVKNALEGKATHEYTIVQDGGGVGEIVMTDAAFFLFGPSARSLSYLFLLLIGVSTCCYVIRYRDIRLSAVPIFLLALSLILLTPLTTAQYDGPTQAPIGGVRYYAVIGILPALHWCFEFIDKPSSGWIRNLLRWLLLVIQAGILTISISVRGSPLYLMLSIIAVAAFVFTMSSRQHRNAIIGNLTMLGAILVVATSVLPRVEFQEYNTAGRLYPHVWHRVLIHFAENPAWPFPGLDTSARFDCHEAFGEGIPQHRDNIGHCAWLARAKNDGIPASIASDKLYDADYNATMRDTVFYIARHYPYETFKTFFYYKPMLMADVLLRGLHFSFDKTKIIVPVILLQLCLFFIYSLLHLTPSPFQDAALRISAVMLLALPALIPQFVAATKAPAAVDLFAYTFAFGIVLLWLLLDYCRKALSSMFGQRDFGQRAPH
jgi:hypothetical protein